MERLSENYLSRFLSLDDGRIRLGMGDCLDLIQSLPDDCLDSVVTDPPYGLSEHSPTEVGKCLAAWLAGKPYLPKAKGGFMGNAWDAWVPGPEIWREVLRVLKPGAHALVFAGTRSMDLMMMALRLSGFDIRDSIGYASDKSDPFQTGLLAWVYGQGFPKSLDIAKSIGKAGGGESEAARWAGWGTALKPAWEPIILIRKPFAGRVSDNVLRHGTGALHIDASRIDGDSQGRWPANVVIDGSNAVKGLFPAEAGARAPVTGREGSPASTGRSTQKRERVPGMFHADTGSAARFFYCAKASPTDRHEGCGKPESQFRHGALLSDIRNAAKNGFSEAGNPHPTVKPTALLRYLIRLVTPPGGVVGDFFMGSGSTGKAAALDGFGFVGIEQEQSSFDISVKRISFAANQKSNTSTR